MTLPSHRSAGICLHLTSLPGEFGIGEIGSRARHFVDFLARSGIGIWQFLPVGPTAYGNSPYQPLSIYAGNPLLIDVSVLLDRGLLSEGELAPLKRLPTDVVDYPEVITHKSRILRLAARRFLQTADAEQSVAFETYCDANDGRWLQDFALFEVLKSRHGERAWPEWEPPYRSREPAALMELEQSAADEIQTIKAIQFFFAEQWQALHAYARKRGVRLFGDLPIYIALDSADAWACNELLLLDGAGRPTFVAGVPPDYFSEDGQLWGNPIYDWDYHERSRYHWWIDRLRHAIALNDMVRIDHFRGFESYWTVPAGADSARDGEWRKGPADRIFNAMRAALGSLPIVAEDLGIITDEVDALRERQKFPGMKVLQFLIGEPGFTLGGIPEDCVCYTGTHDNDTTAGWFRGSTDELTSDAAINARRQAVLSLTGGREETVAQDLFRLALDSPAMIAIAPMQDLLGLGSGARLNIPGSTTGNWRWRLREEALSDSLRRAVGGWLTDSGRSSSAVLHS